jgi:hypothetical protein
VASSSWPLDPTWELLHSEYACAANAIPLDENAQQVVRGARYTGKSRLLRRMLLGVVDSLEVEDASPTATSLWTLHRWIEATAARKAECAQARRARYEAKYGSVPTWVEQGMGARLERVEQVRHRVQMLLGIFAARGILPLHLYARPRQEVARRLTEALRDQAKGFPIVGEKQTLA